MRILLGIWREPSWRGLKRWEAIVVIVVGLDVDVDVDGVDYIDKDYIYTSVLLPLFNDVIESAYQSLNNIRK